MSEPVLLLLQSQAVLTLQPLPAGSHCRADGQAVAVKKKRRKK
jgi:hypothetical protein